MGDGTMNRRRLAYACITNRNRLLVFAHTDSPGPAWTEDQGSCRGLAGGVQDIPAGVDYGSSA